MAKKSPATKGAKAGKSAGPGGKSRGPAFGKGGKSAAPKGKGKRRQDDDDDDFVITREGLPDGFVDSEIDESDAFNSDDEALYGEMFSSKSKSSATSRKFPVPASAKGGKKPAVADSDEDSGASESEELAINSDGEIDYTDDDADAIGLDEEWDLMEQQEAEAKAKADKKAAKAAAKASPAKSSKAVEAPVVKGRGAALLSALPSSKSAAKDKKKPVAMDDSDNDDDEDDDDEDEDEDDEIPDLSLLLSAADGNSASDDASLTATQRRTQAEFLTMLDKLEEEDKRRAEVNAAARAARPGFKRQGELVSLESQRSERMKEDALGTVPHMKFDDGLGDDDDDDDGGDALFARMGVSIAAKPSAKDSKASSADADSKLTVSSLLATLEQAAASIRAPKKGKGGDSDDEDDEDDDDIEDKEAGDGTHLASAAATLAKQLRRLNRTDAVRTLAAPLSDFEREALEREIAHEATAQAVSRWDPYVIKQRESTRLTFAESKPAKRIQTAASLMATFNPVSDLERDLADVMKTYGVSEAEMRARERDTLAAASVTEEETRERQAKLRRMRALMFYHEQKHRYIAKIKSKRHRRFQKAQRERGKLSIEELEEVDPELAAIERLKQEMKRARERATLTHTTTSRWARKQLRRNGDGAEESRKAIEDQIAIGRELRTKMARMGGSGDGDDGSDAPAHGDDDERADSELDSEEEAERDERRLQALRREYGADGEAADSDEDGELDYVPPRPGQGSGGLSGAGKPGSAAKGVLGLAFMQRAAEKQKAQARAMLEDRATMSGDEGADVADDADAAAFGEDRTGAAAARVQAATDAREGAGAKTERAGRRQVGAGAESNAADAKAALRAKRAAAAAAAEGREPTVIARGSETKTAEQARAAAAASKSAAVAALSGRGITGKAGTAGSGGLFDVAMTDFADDDDDESAAAAAAASAAASSNGKPGALSSALAQLSAQERARRIEAKKEKEEAEARAAAEIDDSDDSDDEETTAHKRASAKKRGGAGSDDEDVDVDVNVDDLVLSDDEGSDADADAARDVGKNKIVAPAARVQRASKADAVKGGVSAADLSSDDENEADEEKEGNEANPWARSSASEARGARAAPMRGTAHTAQSAKLGAAGSAALGSHKPSAAAIAAAGSLAAATAAAAAAAAAGGNVLPGAVGALAGAGDVVLDMSTSVIARPALVAGGDVDDERYDGEDAGAAVDLMAESEQARLVAMAFQQGGDEAAEFEKRKQSNIDATLPKDDPLAGGMPGWGAWAGAGKIKVSAQRRKKEDELRAKSLAETEAKRKAVLAARTDLKLKGVELTQKVDKAAQMYQIAHVPYPYTSREQYERAMRNPIGKEWQTQDSHRKMVMPAIVSRPGIAILPAKWTKGKEAIAVAGKGNNTVQAAGKSKRAAPTSGGVGIAGGESKAKIARAAK